MAANQKAQGKTSLSQITLGRFALSSLTNGNIMNVTNTFYSFFLTNVIMISATDMGTVQFLSRICSALIVPFLSSLVQDTNIGKKKLGKYRTLLLIVCPLVSIFFILTFIDWKFGRVGQMAYYWITYFIGITLFTIPQTCVQTLMGRMGNLEDTRTIAARRSLFSTLCTLISSSLTLPMVMYFGGGEKNAKGYFAAILIYSVWYMLGYFLGTIPVSKHADYFENTVEVAKKAVVEVKLTVKEKFDAFKSKPYFLLTVAALFYYISMTFKAGAQTYFFNYIIGDLSKMTVFLTVGSTMSTVGTVLNGAYTKIMGIRNGYALSLGLQALMFLISFIWGKNYLVFYICVGIVCNFMSGVSVSCILVMQSLCADYHLVESGVDARGFMASMNNLPIKVSSALTAGVVGWGLGAAGYSPKLDVQPDSALFAIKLFAVLIPAIGYGLAALFISMSPLSTAKAAEVTAKAAEIKAAKAEKA